MANTFHLAILAGDLDTAIDFYCNVLGCTKGNSEIKPPDSWCDINFWGNELTLHSSCGGDVTGERHNVDMGNVSVPHFGVHLDAGVFKSLKERLIFKNSSSILGFNDNFFNISLHLLLWLINKSISFLILWLFPNSFCSSVAINRIVERGVPSE